MTLILSVLSNGSGLFTPLSHIKYYYCTHMPCMKKELERHIIEQLASVHEKQEPRNSLSNNEQFSAIPLISISCPIYAIAKQMNINKITQFQCVSIDQFIEKAKITYCFWYETNKCVCAHTYTETIWSLRLEFKVFGSGGVQVMLSKDGTTTERLSPSSSSSSHHLVL